MLKSFLKKRSFVEILLPQRSSALTDRILQPSYAQAIFPSVYDNL